MTGLGGRFAAGLIAAAVSLAIAVPSASAATEFGSDCSANTAASGLVGLSLSHGSGSPLPVAAPVSGVITSWRTTSELEIPAELEVLAAPELLVLRPAGAPDQFDLIGRSQAPRLAEGLNVYPTRIPVQQGDHLGIGGGIATLFCQTGDSADVAGIEPAGALANDSVNFEAEPGIQVPVGARIEPDADNDGYGDETQDGCPQSAAYHSACPVVTIGSAAYAGRKKVTVYVATSLGAPVSVGGSVAIGKGKSATLKATAGPVVPGQLAAFTLPLPQALLKQLKETPRSKKLTVTVTASATNVNGSVSSTAATVKLPGKKKPPKKK